MASTPWGQAALVDEVVLPQHVGESAFATHVQLLETKGGERLVRLAYATDAKSSVRRGPVTLSLGDLERLREELTAHPELASAFDLDSARPPRRPGGRAPRRRASPG